MANIPSGRPHWPPPFHAAAHSASRHQPKAVIVQTKMPVGVSALRKPAPPVYLPKPLAAAVQTKVYSPQQGIQGRRGQLLKAPPRYQPITSNSQIKPQAYSVQAKPNTSSGRLMQNGGKTTAASRALPGMIRSNTNPHAVQASTGAQATAADPAREVLKPAGQNPRPVESPGPSHSRENVVQPKLGFEIEMMVLVDDNGRPVPEKSIIGRVGPHVKIAVDENAKVDAPTPSRPEDQNYDLSPNPNYPGQLALANGWQRRRSGWPWDRYTEYRNPQTGAWQRQHPRGRYGEATRYASILELVTEPYDPETAQGRQDILAAIDAAKNFADQLEATVIGPRARVRLSEIPGVTQGNYRYFVGNSNQPLQTTDASIQSTLGIDLAQLASLIETLDAQYSRNLMVFKHHSDIQYAEGNTVNQAMNAAVVDARATINEIGWNVPPKLFPNDLLGLLVLMCQYLRMGKSFYDVDGRTPLDKNLVAMLSRTDLSVIRQALPNDEATWLNTNANAVKTRLLAKSGRTAIRALFNKPDESRNPSNNRNDISCGQFIDNVFTQANDGVTRYFGGFLQLPMENIDPGSARGNKLGPVFEMRNIATPPSIMNQTEAGRFNRNQWKDLADYFIRLLDTLNQRQEATQGAVPAPAPPALPQVPVLRIQGGSIAQGLQGALGRLRPTQTKVTQLPTGTNVEFA